MRALANLRPVDLSGPEGLDFHEWRRSTATSVEAAALGWNGAVAALVRDVADRFPPNAMRTRNDSWPDQLVHALEGMREPLRSDVILSAAAPMGRNHVLRGGVRAFGATVLEQDLEFMPRQFTYPRFPYFQVEPATSSSLAAAGLILFANLPGPDEEESVEIGTAINRDTYVRAPMISVAAELEPLGEAEDGALLCNWSARGRLGTTAKLFVDGALDVPPFEVASIDEDRTPNFWTIIPWRPGPVVIDLKPCGHGGYMWFEHVDMHHVRWQR